MLDESQLEELKADIMAQMRDSAKRKLRSKGYGVKEIANTERNINLAVNTLLIDRDISDEIRDGEMKRQVTEVGRIMEDELNA